MKYVIWFTIVQECQSKLCQSKMHADDAVFAKQKAEKIKELLGSAWDANVGFAWSVLSTLKRTRQIHHLNSAKKTRQKETISWSSVSTGLTKMHGTGFSHQIKLKIDLFAQTRQQITDKMWSIHLHIVTYNHMWVLFYYASLLRVIWWCLVAVGVVVVCCVSMSGKIPKYGHFGGIWRQNPHYGYSCFPKHSTNA